MGKTSFGTQLQKLREKKGCTQQEMGDLLCVHRTTYRNYEMGKTEPSIATLIRLADFFGTSVDDLLCRTEDLDQKKKTEE